LSQRRWANQLLVSRRALAARPSRVSGNYGRQSGCQGALMHTYSDG